MLPILALVAAGATLAQAQSSVISVILPQLGDNTAIVGSVVAVSGSVTSIAIQCSPGTDSTECGIGQGGNIVVGPSTLEWHLTYADVATADTNCQITSVGEILVCTGDLTQIDESASATGAVSFTSTSHDVETLTGFSDYIVPVTLTAGLEKLAAATSTSDSTSAPTSAPTAASTAASNAASTSASTGGVPRITAQAVLVAMAGGAAAMMM
ncbi:hypothetical protein B0T17DRAFT_618510 [Bombardia bombarda]|uniref:GPI anchored cell wall protein n=1 Tax=Bombardia bombarda TaxID=252184 RepID=A0AA39WM21_9PEZI|nr:hypothetical protein B0T17DRAFT_618510 [Bombardia bombarda]